MKEVVIWKIADLALSLIAIGVQRKLVLDKIRAMEEAGATGEEIKNALATIADTAIDAAQAKIDALPG